MRRENCLTLSISRVFVSFLRSMANGTIQVAFRNFSCADRVLTLVKVTAADREKSSKTQTQISFCSFARQHHQNVRTTSCIASAYSLSRGELNRNSELLLSDWLEPILQCSMTCVFFVLSCGLTFIRIREFYLPSVLPSSHFEKRQCISQLWSACLTASVICKAGSLVVTTV